MELDDMQIYEMCDARAHCCPLLEWRQTARLDLTEIFAELILVLCEHVFVVRKQCHIVLNLSYWLRSKDALVCWWSCCCSHDQSVVGFGERA